MSMRNMVAMFGAMALLRRIDQEEPLVLLYVRIGYLVYVGLTAGLYIILHFRIVARRDTTEIEVPIASKPPSFSEAMEQARLASEKAAAEKERLESSDNNQSTTTTTTTTTATTTTTTTATPNTTTTEATSNEDGEEEEEKDDDDKEKEKEKEKVEKITIMEYDLRHLANARRSWVTSSCFLAAVHYHMQSVSPLFMSAVMGAMRMVTEDPLVQIYIRGAAATEKLARPFTPEKNPLASMLKDFAPKEGDAATASTVTGTAQPQSTPEDDLHDDGDDEEDEDATANAAATVTNDDHIKSDFDDDEADPNAKKDQ